MDGGIIGWLFFKCLGMIAADGTLKRSFHRGRVEHRKVDPAFVLWMTVDGLDGFGFFNRKQKKRDNSGIS